MIDNTWARLRRAAVGYQESCVLAAAAELDIFTLILESGNRMPGQDIQARLASDRRGCAVLLDCLAALGYLRKNGAGEEALYSVPEEYHPYLDRRHPDSFVPMLRHMANAQRIWPQLARVVKYGERPERVSSILGSEEDYASFILGMNSIARFDAAPMAQALVKAGILDEKAEDFRFLDVGGASGTYTEAFLKAAPLSRGAIFDLPAGILQARRRFLGGELEGRVDLLEGDFYENELPGGFDLVWISAVIHQQARPESRDLYRKAFLAMKPGGLVAVRDFMLDATRTDPPDGALFAVNMLVHTSQGMAYTYEEVREDLELSGFREISLAIPAPTMSAVAVGRKGI
ncbi:acetylserotonin O-methyltransferase [Desulfovibrio sp. OttesenSCG-928-C14]|nr:acetylserotonin O-methyltransferase [Desulfovibrio sp. OttesenSCG-928-C14]